MVRRTHATGFRSYIITLIACSAGVTAVRAAEPPPLPSKLKVEGTAHTRVVAYIYGNIPITRDELIDFLITRGGADKLQSFVNKRVVEVEAAHRGITVTAKEVEATLNEDLKGVQQREIVNMILQRYGKTLHEWREDVVRPRLLLGKLAGDGVKTSEEEIRIAHDATYGEKRQARIIVWPKDKPPSAQVLAAIRTNEQEFDKAAASQMDQKLAESRGRISPVSRHLEADDGTAVKVLFALALNQTSDLFETKTNCMLVQCTAIIPPDAEHSLDKPAVRNEIERMVIDKKLEKAIPAMLNELLDRYKPTLAYAKPDDVKQANYGAPVPPFPPGPPEQVLATILGPKGPISITRAQFGEFLISRHGAEKLELLVNRRIVQTEATRRGVDFTQAEIDTALDEMIKTANVDKKVFVEQLLPKNKKSLYEYVEDVVKPDVVLRKLVRDRVKVTDTDLKKAFERAYGEKRQCQIIIWPKGEEKVALKEWTAITNKQTDFDRVARKQADPNLAAAGGRVSPIGRHVDAEDPVIEQVVFGLAKGEMSHLLQTRTGTMCIRCTAIIPADEKVTLEMVKAQLEKEEFERFVTKEIPKYFAEIKKAASPTMLLQAGSTPGEFEAAVRERVNEVVKEKK